MKVVHSPRNRVVVIARRTDGGRYRTRRLGLPMREDGNVLKIDDLRSWEGRPSPRCISRSESDSSGPQARPADRAGREAGDSLNASEAAAWFRRAAEQDDDRVQFVPATLYPKMAWESRRIIPKPQYGTEGRPNWRTSERGLVSPSRTRSAALSGRITKRPPRGVRRREHGHGPRRVESTWSPSRRRHPTPSHLGEMAR